MYKNVIVDETPKGFKSTRGSVKPTNTPQQFTKQQRSDAFIGKHDTSASSESLSNSETKYGQNMKKQELLTSLTNDNKFFNKGSFIYNQKTTRHHDLQADENRLQELQEQNSILTRTNASLTNTLKGRDEQLDRLSHLYFQEQEKSSKAVQKFTQCKVELENMHTEVEQLHSSNLTLLHEQQVAQAEYHAKIQTLENSYRIIQDLREREKEEMNHVLMQKDAKITELQNRLKGLGGDTQEYSIRSQHSTLDKDDSHSKSKILGELDLRSSFTLDAPEKRRLLKQLDEKSSQINEQNEIIKNLHEKLAKMVRNLKDSKVEWCKQKEVWNKLSNEYDKLKAQMNSLNNADVKDLITQNLELRDQLSKAQMVIEELEERLHKEVQFFSPRDSEVHRNEHNDYNFHPNSNFPMVRETIEPYHSYLNDHRHDAAKDRPQSSQILNPVQKSPSINSLGSALSLDRRSAIERFNKMAAATAGMMSNYLDYQSLNNYSKQAEKVLRGAQIDLTQNIAKRQGSSSDIYHDGN